jgi:hypothetical protein
MTHFARLLSAALVAWSLCVSFAIAQTKPPVDPDAVFNAQSKTYHRDTCTSARRCTKNCVVIKLSDGQKRGGRACQICGGPATAQDDRHESLDNFAASH